MKRTVWDRVDGAVTLDAAHWEGDDAPTNVAPPAFARAKSSPGFWKGVIVGVGVSATLAAFTALGGGVVAVAVYGLPVRAASAPAAIASQVDDVVEAPVAVREREVVRPVVEEPVVRERQAVRPVVEEPVVRVREAVRPVVVEPVVVAAKVEPVVTRPVVREEPRPAPKVVASRPKPVVEARRAPAPVEKPEPVVVKVVATPAPVREIVREREVLPEPPRPNRDELLQLALAARKTSPAPKATPAPASKWEEPEAKSDAAPASDEKWTPVDDIEDVSGSSKDSSSDDLSSVLEN